MIRPDHFLSRRPEAGSAFFHGAGIFGRLRGCEKLRQERHLCRETVPEDPTKPRRGAIFVSTNARSDKGCDKVFASAGFFLQRPPKPKAALLGANEVASTQHPRHPCAREPSRAIQWPLGAIMRRRRVFI